MCNQPDNITRQLDEQRMLYMYQGLNAVMALLNQYLNPQPVDTLTQAYEKADEGQIIAMAFMAFKNGNITQAQYEEIFDIVTGTKTVKTSAYTVPQSNLTRYWGK